MSVFANRMLASTSNLLNEATLEHSKKITGYYKSFEDKLERAHKDLTAPFNEAQKTVDDHPHLDANVLTCRIVGILTRNDLVSTELAKRFAADLINNYSPRKPHN